MVKPAAKITACLRARLSRELTELGQEIGNHRDLILREEWKDPRENQSETAKADRMARFLRQKEAWDATDFGFRWLAVLPHRRKVWPKGLPLPLTVGDALNVAQRDADGIAQEVARHIMAAARELVDPKLLGAVLARPDVAKLWPWPKPLESAPEAAGLLALHAMQLPYTTQLPRDGERVWKDLQGNQHRYPRDEVRRYPCVPMWPGKAAPFDVAQWAKDILNVLEPGYGDLVFAEADHGPLSRGVAWTDTDGLPVCLPVGGLALLYLAEREVDRDRRRSFVAVDAGKEHHALLSGWGKLVKESRLKDGHRPRIWRDSRKGKQVWVELFGPGLSTQLSLPLEDTTPGIEVIRAVKRLAKWEGVRSWVALQRLLSIEGERAGWVRWTLDAHLEAADYAHGRRRDPETRNRVAEHVELFTRFELAVIVGGKTRERRPLMLIGGRFEHLEGSRWKLDGMELQINPLLYRGVRNEETGRLGRHWYPTVPGLAQLDHRYYGPALMLGQVLAIRWRWDLGKTDYLTISGDRLLKLACIPFDRHDPKRAWKALKRNLDKLQSIDALGRWEADDGGWALDAMYRLPPPAWTVDRLRHHVPVIEARVADLPWTGVELRAWRKAHGWTQARLARLLGVSKPTIGRAEQGGNAPLTKAVRGGLEQAKTE